jgi:hypothetical protein
VEGTWLYNHIGLYRQGELRKQQTCPTTWLCVFVHHPGIVGSDLKSSMS